MSSQETVDVVAISPGRKKILIAAVLLMSAGFTFSGYGAGIATPAKLEQIGASDYYALCSALTTLGMGLMLPLAGKLTQLFGQKTVAAAGMLFQLAMRLLAMLSSTLLPFILTTMLSYIGAGAYLALPYVFISELVAEKTRPRYFGIITTCNALGALTGPLMVGQLMDWGYTNLGFIAHAPFIMLSVVLLLALYPQTKPQKPDKEKLDWLGILFLIIGLGCIILWLNLGGKAFPWGGLLGILLPVSGIAALTLLIWYEGRHPNPSIPLKAFQRKSFRAAFSCTFLLAAFNSCMAGFCIVYAQQVMRVSPQLSATVTMPQTIMQAFCGILAGRILTANFPKNFQRSALPALFLVAVSAIPLIMLTPEASMLKLYLAGFLGGIGMSFVSTALPPFFQTELEPREYAAAQGMYSFGAIGGTCIFSALAGVLLNAGLSYNYVFLMAGGFCLAALAVGVVTFRLPSPSAAPCEKNV